MKSTMKTLTILIVAFLGFTSCTKDLEPYIYKEPEFPVQKNEFRAKIINGSNYKWGEFKQILNYSNEKLVSATVINNIGDTIGGITVDHGATTIYYSEYELIPAIDSISILEIEDSLKAKYGEGNYNLFREVPKVLRRSKVQDLSLYRDGRVKRLITKSYKPRKNVGIGTKFNNTYILDVTEANVFEYDDKGNIVVNRITIDIHDEKDEQKYSRSLYKYENSFIENKISEINYFEVESGGNYVLKDIFDFEYRENQLVGIGSDSYQRKFDYSNNQITVNEDGKTSIYQLDVKGYVIKITDHTDKITSIEYESGHGDFSVFSSLIETQLGTPLIK